MILYKFEADRYMLVVNASNIEKDLNFLNSKNNYKTQIIDVSKGESVGYNRAYVAKEKTKVGIVFHRYWS